MARACSPGILGSTRDSPRKNTKHLAALRKAEMEGSPICSGLCLLNTFNGCHFLKYTQGGLVRWPRGCCSSKGPNFGSQHSCQVAHNILETGLIIQSLQLRSRAGKTTPKQKVPCSVCGTGTGGPGWYQDHLVQEASHLLPDTQRRRPYLLL